MIVRSLRRHGTVVWTIAGVALAAGLALRRPPSETSPPTARNEAGERIRVARASLGGADDGGADCYVGVAVAAVEADVQARVEGSVREIAVEVGQAVEADRLLARLDAGTLRHRLASERAAYEAAQAEKRRAELRAELAEHTHRRAVSLTDLLSKEQIEESRFELDGARLEAEAAAARLRQAQGRIEEVETLLSRSEVRAPFDGVVGAVYTEPGALVTSGTPVLRLIGGSARIRFALPPDRIGRVERREPVRVWVEDLGYGTTARVSSVAPDIDPESQMVFVEAALDPDRPVGERVPVGAIVRVAPAGAEGYCRGRP